MTYTEETNLVRRAKYLLRHLDNLRTQRFDRCSLVQRAQVARDIEAIHARLGVK